MQPFFTPVAIQPDTWSYETLQGKKTHLGTERRQSGALEPCHTPPYSGWRSQGWHVVKEVKVKPLCHLGVSLYLPASVV